MKRPFLTRPEADRQLLVFAVVAILVEYVLNALNNVVSGLEMALIWLGGGCVVGLIVVATAKLKSRRRQ